MRAAITTISIVLLALAICFAGCAKKNTELKIPAKYIIHQSPDFVPPNLKPVISDGR